MSEWEGTITLYFKCLNPKCLKYDKVQSHLAHPPEVGPFKDCPYCGGEIEFEPNCWTCAEFNGVLCDIANCIGFKFYKQRKVKA